MPHASDLHTQIHARFHAAFGEPTNSLGQAEQWSLQPERGPLKIMLFLNGPVESSAVWMLDPYDRIDEVEKLSIANQAEIGPAIARVHARVERAERRLRLDDESPRMQMFIEALRGWCEAMCNGRSDCAVFEVEKLKIATGFISESDTFRRAFALGAHKDVPQDPQLVSRCMGAFMNALCRSSG